jgi:hypothetical protein
MPKGIASDLRQVYSCFVRAKHNTYQLATTRCTRATSTSMPPNAPTWTAPAVGRHSRSPTGVRQHSRCPASRCTAPNASGHAPPHSVTHLTLPSSAYHTKLHPYIVAVHNVRNQRGLYKSVLAFCLTENACAGEEESFVCAPCSRWGTEDALDESPFRIRSSYDSRLRWQRCHKPLETGPHRSVSDHCDHTTVYCNNNSRGDGTCPSDYGYWVVDTAPHQKCEIRIQLELRVRRGRPSGEGGVGSHRSPQWRRPHKRQSATTGW